MRMTSRFSRTLLACLLAAGITFPAPAIAFAAGAEGDASAAEALATTVTASTDGAQTQNDPALFDGVIDGVDAEGILVTLDDDAVSLLFLFCYA